MQDSIAVSLPRKINSETEIVSEAKDFVNWEDHSQNKSRGYSKKATSICQNLYENNVDIRTPSQSGIYKSVFRKAD